MLWEYRSLGKLTTAIIATVALDDALAMTLYGLGKSAAELLAVGTADIGFEMLKVLQELGGAVFVGGGLGFLLTYLLRRTHQREKSLALSIGAVLLAIGISTTLGLDLILTTMTLGIVLTNFSPKRAHELFDLVRTVSIPVYVLFFVLVGARLHIGNLPGWLWLLVVFYVVGRNVGKMVGTFLAADVMGPKPETVAPGTCLSEAVTLMNDTGAEELLVADKDSEKPIGVIDRRRVKHAIHEKLLKLRGEE